MEALFFDLKKSCVWFFKKYLFAKKNFDILRSCKNSYFDNHITNVPFIWREDLKISSLVSKKGCNIKLVWEKLFL